MEARQRTRRISVLPISFPDCKETKMKLTKPAAAQVTVPAGKAEVIAWDDSIPGFGLRARAGGSRNWIFQYRQGRKQRRISVGAASAMTTEAARQRAAQLHAEVKLGRDPAGQKFEDRARAHETFDHALPLYLSHKKATLRPRRHAR